MAHNPRITDWRGKRVWLVGASTGIGAALAQRLAQQGARLALSARGEAGLHTLAQTLPDALVLPLDVTQESAVIAARAAIEARFGGLDVVVLNAGAYTPMRAWELDVAAARRMVDVNFMGVIHGVAATLPGFLHQGSGAVVIVGSVAGYRGLPRSLIYGATKSALINFAETLWVDVAPRGVGVHLVSPGFVATPLTAHNDFNMPALITADEAADEMLKGLARGEFEIHFPKRFTRWMKFMELLPYGVYFRLVRRITGL